MKIYVIKKDSGATLVTDYASLEEAAGADVAQGAFMLVAAEYVPDGECYQAIQVAGDKVLFNRKSNVSSHQYVEADSITNAFALIATDEPVEPAAANTEPEPVQEPVYDPSFDEDDDNETFGDDE